jgi:hypothetical protein
MRSYVDRIKLYASDGWTAVLSEEGTTVARMSPVSRGRKKKRSSKHAVKATGGVQRTNMQHTAPATLESPLERLMKPRERPAWFEPSITRVLENASALPSSRGPRELEQLTAELLGGELHRTVQEGNSGLWFDWWLAELVDAAAARIKRDAEWKPAFWLLHGLGALATPGLLAQIPLRQAKAWVRDKATDPLPEWLPQVPRIRATGDVYRIHDAYGTRFGVIIGLDYPGADDRGVHLFDIDASGFVQLVGGGVFDDVEQAASAWRDVVGESGRDASHEPVTDSDQLQCLTRVDSDREVISGYESRVVMDNWFRAARRIHDLVAALKKRGMRLPETGSLHHDIDTSVMTEPFTAWCADAFDAKPDPEAVEALAGEWMEGALPETWFAASPHRVKHKLELIGDWIDDPVTDAVREILPDWVRWLSARAGVPEHLAERSILVAQLQ